MATEISDWNDLDNVRNDLTGDYVLVNDLDSDTDGYGGIGDDFEPIGGGGNGFTGQLDGGSFEIKDLVIDKPNETFVGLFGQLGTATSVGGSVFDLTVAADVTGAGESFDEGTGVLAGTARGDTQLTNVTVKGQVSQPNGDFGAGGLVGIAREEDTELKIENCISHVDVIAGSSGRVGGIVGYFFDDSGGLVITESYATGSVEGDERVGGLVGQNEDTIETSYVTASVEGNDQVGGLVGRNEATITESYATGSVEGNDEVGGLAGRSGSGSLIDKTYSLGNVTGSDEVGGLYGAGFTVDVSESYAVGNVAGDTNVGGFAGNSGDGNRERNYFNTESTTQSDAFGTSDGGGGVTGLTTTEMQGSEAETNMDGFDFANVWATVEGDAETINGQITLDDVAAETATVILHNFSEPEGIDSLVDGYPILLSVDEGEQLESQNAVVKNISRTETDTDGNYSAEIPGAAGDTIAVGVDFDDGTERYGRLVTTVLE